MRPPRIAAPSVLLMECILRFRRPATTVLFLVACAAAFLLMPETGSGGVMFLIGKQRTLLNSAVTALTSAIMGGFIFSLMGFYIISNSVTRDLESGVGKLIAATPLSSLRYLAGKLAGNILYLTAMAVVFMIACMGMHLLRGEMPLEPVVFIETFAIMFVPSIPCVAAIALMFECVPFLSGRGGDVFYFMFWMFALILPLAVASASNGHEWILSADFTGLAFFSNEISRVTGAHNFTIGYAPYNASLPPLFFQGLLWIPEIVLPRLASVLFAIPFFAIAWTAFQRFDPARRSGRGTTKAGKAATLLQPVVSAWLRVAALGGGWLVGPPAFVKAIVLDVRLTLALSPVYILAILVSWSSGLFMPLDAIRTILFPCMFFALVPFLAPISTRDGQRNTAQLLFTAPHVRMHFAVLKFFSALFAALLIGFVPLVRVRLSDPFGAVAVVNAIVFCAAAATLLGVTTRTPKTFVVLFLLFLYTVVSSKTISALDFAGLQGSATPGITGAYAAATLLMLGTAVVCERWRMLKGDSL